jgi:hypothetical protein
MCVSIDVRGVLHWNNRKLVQTFRGIRFGGRALNTATEIRDAFLDQLAAGREQLPIGKPCDAWDWKTGCRGHVGLSADGERS